MAILDQLTDEQKAELLQEVAQHNEQQRQQQQAQEVTVQGFDGQPITGTPEQINQTLQQQRQQLEQRLATQPDNTQGVEQKQQFNQDSWKEQILQDAPTATNAALTHHLGFEPKAGFEAIGAALAQVGRASQRARPHRICPA